MAANLNRPERWKEDIARSVDLYNEWFLEFAPKTYRDQRAKTAKHVEVMLDRTDHLAKLTPQVLQERPRILWSLRMTTAPPIARDRLAGLADVSKSFLAWMERHGKVPSQMSNQDLTANLKRMIQVITRLQDEDVFPWRGENRAPTGPESDRATTIVADRLCGASSDPIVRNAQERRKLAKIKEWLEGRGYTDRSGDVSYDGLNAGEFAFRINAGGLKDDGKNVSIPVDVAVAPLLGSPNRSPLLIEAKSAGDFTNTNKRRKEEAAKVTQLRRKHGDTVQYILFLCGYFDSGYLGYEAAEGIDWVWEHRIDDLAEFGLE